MKTTYTLAALVAGSMFFAGCASDHHTGAVGEDTETGVISGSSGGNTLMPFGPPGDTVETGPNGSIGSGNPFGAGSGTGLQEAD